MDQGASLISEITASWVKQEEAIKTKAEVKKQRSLSPVQVSWEKSTYLSVEIAQGLSSWIPTPRLEGPSACWGSPLRGQGAEPQGVGIDTRLLSPPPSSWAAGAPQHIPGGPEGLPESLWSPGGCLIHTEAFLGPLVSWRAGREGGK